MAFVKTWTPILALLACWLVPAAPAAADIVGSPVEDEAGMFKPDIVKQVIVRLQDLAKQYKHDVIFETIKSVPADQVDKLKTIEDKLQYFQNWSAERVKARKLNGIYIIICNKPPFHYIDIGRKTIDVFPLSHIQNLNAIMLEGFKARDNDKAMLDAMDYIEKALSVKLGKPTYSTKPIK